MDVLKVWPDSDFIHGEWSRHRATSYWVRVSRAELSSVLEYASDPEELAAAIAAVMDGDVVHLLVSEDLDSIVALPGYYPDSGQWNGMSPFQAIPEWHIDHLTELRRGPPPPSAPAGVD